MASISEARGHGAQAWETKSGDSGNLGWFALAVAAVGAAIGIVVVAAIILPQGKETTATVSHVGDRSNIVPIGHLQLTEWKVAGLNNGLSNEVKLGDAVLELHNDGQTVHRLAIWRGGGVNGDQMEGVTLIAETGYIGPGELANLNVNLEPGKYVFICTVPGHLARGMYATVELK